MVPDSLVEAFTSQDKTVQWSYDHSNANDRELYSILKSLKTLAVEGVINRGFKLEIGRNKKILVFNLKNTGREKMRVRIPHSDETRVFCLFKTGKKRLLSNTQMVKWDDSEKLISPGESFSFLGLNESACDHRIVLQWVGGDLSGELISNPF